MIFATGHISGAHINPAVTLAFALSRHFPWRRVPLYVAAQLAGAAAAGLTLLAILGDVAPMWATLPTGSDPQALGLEVVLTFFLMFVIMAVATDAARRVAWPPSPSAQRWPWNPPLPGP